MTVTNCVDSPVNGYCSFMVAPDGSKEGWDASETGDQRREAFVKFLRDKRTTGHLYVDFVEVLYGDDDGACAVVSHNKDGVA